MTDAEKYLFDLRGFVAVPGVLGAETVAALDRTVDERIARECPADMTAHRFGGLLRWGPEFLALIDYPAVTERLDELLGSTFRLDHDYLDVIRSGLGPIGATLHGGATPFDPSQYYAYRDGRMHNGLTVVAFNLRDVAPGDGGFACVPGSHKSRFRRPGGWQDLTVPHETVLPVPGPAGTMIIFTEALTHGTLPWKGRGERRTIFFKYSPHPLSWSAKYYDRGEFEGLTPRQRAILEPPNARYGGRPTAS